MVHDTYHSNCTYICNHMLWFQSSATVAQILEISPLGYVPYFLIKKAIINSLRRQASGTIMVSLSACCVSTVHNCILAIYVLEMQ